ncbi:hypothetical protein M231_00755 [Tremella mesenterica]|uniref:Uncharacterized protein n=1 Tax=Tremella mesenterica TaxID=5217 RepID=A0A4Q1BV60_TREME|nr:hypothetical protein M231_00755 [Tremella mesenterica]
MACILQGPPNTLSGQTQQFPGCSHDYFRLSDLAKKIMSATNMDLEDTYEHIQRLTNQDIGLIMLTGIESLGEFTSCNHWLCKPQYGPKSLLKGVLQHLAKNGDFDPSLIPDWLQPQPQVDFEMVLDLRNIAVKLSTLTQADNWEIKTAVEALKLTDLSLILMAGMEKLVSTSECYKNFQRVQECPNFPGVLVEGLSSPPSSYVLSHDVIGTPDPLTLDSISLLTGPSGTSGGSWGGGGPFINSQMTKAVVNLEETAVDFFLAAISTTQEGTLNFEAQTHSGSRT